MLVPAMPRKSLRLILNMVEGSDTPLRESRNEPTGNAGEYIYGSLNWQDQSLRSTPRGQIGYFRLLRPSMNYQARTLLRYSRLNTPCLEHQGLVLSNYCCDFWQCLQFQATGVKVGAHQPLDALAPRCTHLQSIFGSQT